MTTNFVFLQPKSRTQYWNAFGKCSSLQKRSVTYDFEFKPRAMKDLKGLSHENRDRVMEKIEAMKNDLAGDVKRLTNMTPEYRLRVGDYRVLFELEGTKIVIYRVRHRREAYR